MDKLTKIAADRIELGLDQIIENLESEHEAMLRLHASRGKVENGDTIKWAITHIDGAAGELRNLMIDQFEWVIKESLAATQKVRGELESTLATHFENFRSAAENLFDRNASAAGSPHLFERYISEVSDSINSAQEAVLTELEASLAVRANRGVKRLVKSVFGKIPALLGLQ